MNADRPAVHHRGGCRKGRLRIRTVPGQPRQVQAVCTRCRGTSEPYAKEATQ